MYTPQILEAWQLDKCRRTISSNTFYLEVCDALMSQNKTLSVVRFADGEKLLWNMSLPLNEDDILQPNASLSKEWFDKMGVTGISKKEFQRRLLYAGRICTHAAPSLSGIVMPNYNVYYLFPYHYYYVDNFFPNAWFKDMRENIFKAAKKVVFIHGNSEIGVSAIRNARKIGVDVTWIGMEHWSQADRVIAEVRAMDDVKLVLYSSGPASKHIGPEIAYFKNIVTLDIGQAAHKFTLDWLT